MLTLTLRGLERDGLVERTVYATAPPRVDYALTPLGHSLREAAESLGDWRSHTSTRSKARGRRSTTAPMPRTQRAAGRASSAGRGDP
jgi:DNA-binding HxlR family transcriptional regulator